MQLIDHREFFVGNLLNYDDYFIKYRCFLKPEDFSDESIKKIIEIIIKFDNSTFSIYKEGGKGLALYAMEISNKTEEQKIQKKNIESLIKGNYE